jgi:hypothetical protein
MTEAHDPAKRNGSAPPHSPPAEPDVAADAMPKRDPAINKALDVAILALRSADNELAKLQAISAGAEAIEALDLFGDCDAIDHLSNMAIRVCGLNANLVQIALANGIGSAQKRCEDGKPAGINGAGINNAKAGSNGKATGPAVIIAPTPYRYRHASEIPRREWLYGQHYIRGAVTATIAPGGFTKSIRSLIEIIAMVTRRNLLGVEPGPDKLRGWYWNGEDTRDEIERRIAAICKYYDIDAATELGGLFYDSGHDMPIKIAKADRGGTGSVILNEEVIKRVSAAITDNEIDVAVFDPVINVHSVAENDNVAIDHVVKVFGRIADQTHCSILAYPVVTHSH